MADYDLLIGARRRRTGPWLWCAWFGHRWNGTVDPVCERPRCRWRLSDYNLEWISGDGAESRCPACWCTERAQRHMPDCWLAAELHPGNGEDAPPPK